MVLTPALLFCTMSTVHVEQLNFKPVAMYFVAAILLFAFMFVWRGRNRHAAVLGLGATFGNTLTIGTPLIGLAYGQAGLVTLFTLISLHALILLTLATVVLALTVAHEQAGSGAVGQQHMLATILGAIRNGIIHPVPLPIMVGLLVGLLFAQTGWVLPDVIDRPLHLLGSAFGPLALVLVGATLVQVQVGAQIRHALGLTLFKNLVLPLLVAVFFLLFGLTGIPLAVMIIAASLPMGSNVFMFSQKYEVSQELITASMAVSTAMAMLTISMVMALVARWVV